MSVEGNKEIVRRAFHALMSADFGRLDDVLAPDAVIHQCGFLDPMRIRELRARGRPGGMPIAGRQLHIERMVGEGDLVALHWRATGRYSAPDEPEVDGRPVSVPWMTFVRLENGMIVEIWNIRDTSTLQTQLWEPVAQGGR